MARKRQTWRTLRVSRRLYNEKCRAWVLVPGVAEFVVPCFASSVAMVAGPLVLSENVLSGEQADFDVAVEMATGIIKSVRSCTHS